MMPHGINIHKIEIDMVMEIMIPFPSEINALRHWKCVLQCCDNGPSLVITVEESNSYDINTCTTISFCVY